MICMFRRQLVARIEDGAELDLAALARGHRVLWIPESPRAPWALAAWVVSLSNYALVLFALGLIP